MFFRITEMGQNNFRFETQTIEPIADATVQQSDMAGVEENPKISKNIELNS